MCHKAPLLHVFRIGSDWGFDTNKNEYIPVKNIYKGENLVISVKNLCKL